MYAIAVPISGKDPSYATELLFITLFLAIAISTMVLSGKKVFTAVLNLPVALTKFLTFMGFILFLLLLGLRVNLSGWPEYAIWLFFIVLAFVYLLTIHAMVLCSIKEKVWFSIKGVKVKMFWPAVFSLFLFFGSCAAFVILYSSKTDVIRLMGVGNYQGQFLVNDDFKKALDQAVPYTDKFKTPDERNTAVQDLLSDLGYEQRTNSIKPWVELHIGNLLVISCDQNSQYVFIMSQNPYRLENVFKEKFKNQSQTDQCKQIDSILSSSS